MAYTHTRSQYNIPSFLYMYGICSKIHEILNKIQNYTLHTHTPIHITTVINGETKNLTFFVFLFRLFFCISRTHTINAILILYCVIYPPDWFLF